MMINKIIIFIFSFVIWMFLTWPLDLQHTAVGVLVAAFVASLTGDLFTSKPRRLGNIIRYIWFCVYVPVFLWECLKANIDVAWRVLHPKLPVNPGIVKVKTTLKSDTGLTFLANSITLTPGTFCVDIDPQEGILYVHWIDVRTQDMAEATQLIVSKFEKILKRIFD